ncbi:MAG: TonB-dependent siderophore receptor, partial [Methylocystaceae bacterium]
MHRYRLLRGVSASALGVVCAFSAALAQEALPTIDIDAEGASASGPVRAVSGQNANDSGTSYTGPKTTSSMKTGAPILDTPKSVQIVPKQVLQDNQVLNVQEAVKFVSGVQTAGNVFYDRYLIRGFNSNSNTYRNNLKLLSAIGTEDISFLDRVEIVKGPSAMLFGRIQPGGLVNFVTKKPQEEAEHSVQEQFG